MEWRGPGGVKLQVEWRGPGVAVTGGIARPGCSSYRWNSEAWSVRWSGEARCCSITRTGQPTTTRVTLRLLRQQLCRAATPVFVTPTPLIELAARYLAMGVGVRATGTGKQIAPAVTTRTQQAESIIRRVLLVFSLVNIGEGMSAVCVCVCVCLSVCFCLSVSVSVCLSVL